MRDNLARRKYVKRSEPDKTTGTRARAHTHS